MSIPDFQKLMHPFLEAIKDGCVYSTEQIMEVLRMHFSLTMDDMKVKVLNGNQSLFRNRIDWASNHLHQAGLVISFLKGYYQITEAGEQALTQERVKMMDIAYLRKLDQFQAWETMFDKSKALPENTHTVEVEMRNETSEIIIGKASLMLYQSSKFELLSVIKSRPTSFFEYFIVELLKKIGYKGVDSSNFEVIGKQEKEGTERVMYQDESGIEKIYMQAKKWEMQVTSKDIRNFVGALSLKGTNKGIFITTSTFSPEAKVEAVQNPSHKIALVDYDRLMHLAIKHNVAIQTKRTVEIKGIGENF